MVECEPLERVLYKQFVTDADNMRPERGGTVTPIHEISVIPRPSWSNPWNGGVAGPEKSVIPRPNWSNPWNGGVAVNTVTLGCRIYAPFSYPTTAVSLPALENGSLIWRLNASCTNDHSQSDIS